VELFFYCYKKSVILLLNFVRLLRPSAYYAERGCVMIGCPFLCLSRLSTVATVCGGFAAGCPTVRRYRSIAGASAQ